MNRDHYDPDVEGGWGAALVFLLYMLAGWILVTGGFLP